LGGHKGKKKDYKPSIDPRRPGKDRPKERHSTKVGLNRHVPKPIPLKENVKGKSAKKPKKGVPHPKSQWRADKKLKVSAGCDFSRNTRFPKPKKQRVKVIYQKWRFPDEPWNLLRSPSLRRLKLSLMRVKKGNNPFYKFKDLCRHVKIRTPGRYKRFMSILSGGLVITPLPLGCWVSPQIRKVRKLSFQDLETLISKLPYWATSYEPEIFHKIAVLVENDHVSRKSL
jgi:hypothetical protein